MAGNSMDATTVLAWHNDFRAGHSLAPLIWSSGLASNATNLADHLASFPSCWAPTVSDQHELTSINSTTSWGQTGSTTVSSLFKAWISEDLTDATSLIIANNATVILSSYASTVGCAIGHNSATGCFAFVCVYQGGAVDTKIDQGFTTGTVFAPRQLSSVVIESKATPSDDSSVSSTNRFSDVKVTAFATGTASGHSSVAIASTDSVYDLAVWRNDLKRCYLKSSVWGTPVLNPNANIQFAPFEDLVLGIGTDNLLRWRDPEIPIWKSVGTGMRLLDILQLSDLSFVGVGFDNNLYWASSLHSQWYLVPGSGSVTRIAIMRSNFAWIFGVGMDCELYYVNILQGFNAQGLRGGFKWYHVPNSGCIIDVLQLPNGYVGGIGRDNKLYYMQNFYSLGWQLAPNFNGAITGLAELSDSTLLGIGMDGSVWRMNSWDTGFPDGNGLTKSCCISAITSAI